MQYYPVSQKEILKAIETVPLCETPLEAPTLGVVVNVNAKMNAHRDSCDLDYCVIITAGKYGGAQLVLYELNLVIELPPGMMASFKSGEITHLNFELIKVGEETRYSFIIHSDKFISNFAITKNNWGHAIN